MSLRSILVLVALSSLAAPLSGQDEGADARWRGFVGGGVGIHLRCAECDAEPVGVGGTVGLERELRPGLAIGLAWTGAWFDSDLGRLNRHMIHLDLLVRRQSSFAPFVRLGLGTGISTRIQKEGPPDPPGVGDAVISIGDTQGYGGLIGAGFERTLSPSLALVPELRLAVQRVEGATLAHAVALFSLGIG